MRGQRRPTSTLCQLLCMAFMLAPLTAGADEQRIKTLEEATQQNSNGLQTPSRRKPSALLAEYPMSDGETPPATAIDLLGHNIQRGSFQRLYWTAGQAVAGLSMPTPVLVAAGIEPGPTLCLTAAVHGDELNGVESIRRVMFSLESDKLKGTVIGVPIVNMHGFLRTSRYLPDRRDLNRYFPGDPNGSSAARIAHSLFNEVIAHCDRLIDIHTGSFHRTNLTQLRSDLGNEQVKEFSRMFHDVMVLDGGGARGTLRRAAVDAGIPAVTLEAGEPLRLQLKEVNQSVAGIQTVMRHLGMTDEAPGKRPDQTVFYKSTWLRSSQSGVFLTEAKLGQKVKKGDILGTVTDPITNRSTVIRSTVDGKIIGMALNQMVMPGFAAYHIGIATDEKKATAEKVADSVVAEALEPVAEGLKEAAREAAQSAAEKSDNPEDVTAAVREAVKAAAKDTPKIVEESAKEDSKSSNTRNKEDRGASAPGADTSEQPDTEPTARPAPAPTTDKQHSGNPPEDEAEAEDEPAMPEATQPSEQEDHPD